MYGNLDGRNQDLLLFLIIPIFYSLLVYPLFHFPHSKSLLLLMFQEVEEREVEEREVEEREVEGKMMTLSTPGLVPIIDVSTYPISLFLLV